ncbi:hypothetical protein E2C01_088940 [Portunus trituberculatus]|uniref:Uncharacterized protein n=1 Tax=Portunus trituberculatus TaxID=210409 RepID=A0A5B7JL67_PORTR|nr:hypothetical protein [Portunus trituberculatus]
MPRVVFSGQTAPSARAVGQRKVRWEG